MSQTDFNLFCHFIKRLGTKMLTIIIKTLISQKMLKEYEAKLLEFREYTFNGNAERNYEIDRISNMMKGC